MPFQSKSQQRWAYANPEKLGGKAKVKEWSDATDYSALPEKKSEKPKKFSHARPK